MIREFLQAVAQRKKKKEGSAFGPGDHRERAESDGDHEEMDVDPAAFEHVPEIVSGEPAAAEIGDDEARNDRRWIRICALEKETGQSAEAAERGECKHDAVIARDRPWRRTWTPARPRGGFWLRGNIEWLRQESVHTAVCAIGTDRSQRRLLKAARFLGASRNKSAGKKCRGFSKRR